MLKELIDKKVVECIKCSACRLVENDNSQEEKGYGKLVSKEYGKKIMIVGLQPSRNRFAGLKHPFGGGENFKKDRNAKFLEIFKELNVLKHCYITNAVKCSTRDNKPTRWMIDRCETHLIREIKYCKPKLIIAVGNEAERILIRTGKYLDRIVRIPHPSYVYSYHQIDEVEYKILIENTLKESNIL